LIVDFSWRGWWTTLHGVVLAATFLLLLVLTFTSLIQLRSELLTPDGVEVRLRWLKRGLLFMMVVGWAAIALGTFVIDGWFNQHLPGSPYTLLNAREAWAPWQGFVMEWKERISWVSALVATTGAYLVFYYGPQLAHDVRARSRVLTLFVVSLATGSAAGIMGVLLAKLVPLR
jgi:hypothetical protein